MAKLPEAAPTSSRTGRYSYSPHLGRHPAGLISVSDHEDQDQRGSPIDCRQQPVRHGDADDRRVVIILIEHEPLTRMPLGKSSSGSGASPIWEVWVCHALVAVARMGTCWSFRHRKPWPRPATDRVSVRWEGIGFVASRRLHRSSGVTTRRSQAEQRHVQEPFPGSSPQSWTSGTRTASSSSI